MKKLLFITVPVLLVLAFAFWFLGKDDESVQRYVEDEYMNKEKLIHAYPKKTESQYLSESIGLYMDYLLLKDDEVAFSRQVDALKTHFLAESSTPYIRWVLKENTDVNALIDDVRIIHALYTGADQFDQTSYKELADKLTRGIESDQMAGGIYADFRDGKTGTAAQRITLSYLTPDLFNVLKNTDPSKNLLVSLNKDELFFPEYYDIGAQEYVKANDVHMIDQLLIALNRYSAGQSSPAFQEWILEEWDKEGKLYGQYDRNNHVPTVSYESLAVYAYAFSYFQEIGENDIAKEIQQRAEQLAEQGALADAHFFDYIHYEIMKAAS